MELLSRLRLRKTQSQNPEFHHLTPQTNNSEMETHDSARIHNVETKESFTEKKEEKDEDGTSEGRSTAPPFPVREMEKRAIDSPPADDCCPICFGSFAVACRASCGHWYCGGCILQYWNYGAALQPCKCPLCFRQITSLRPEASLYHQQEVGVTDVLKNVQKYNRLFVGGTYGFFLRMLEMPFFMKRVFQGLMDPDRVFVYHNKLRLFAMFLGVLYAISPFDFLPTGRMSAVDIFDFSTIVLSLILYFVGHYLRRRRLQNVRELAVIQP